MHNISDNNLSMYCLKKNCHIDFLFPRKRHQTHPIQFKWIFCFSVWIDSSVIREDFDCFLLRSWGFLWTIFIEGWGGGRKPPQKSIPLTSLHFPCGTLLFALLSPQWHPLEYLLGTPSCFSHCLVEHWKP